jgi:hypothetical protein
MNMNDFLDIIEEFLGMMHPNYCDDYVEENVDFELWQIFEKFFEHIGPQI